VRKIYFVTTSLTSLFYSAIALKIHLSQGAHDALSIHPGYHLVERGTMEIKVGTMEIKVFVHDLYLLSLPTLGSLTCSV